MWPTPQAHDAATPKTPEQIEAARARQPSRKGGGPPGIRNLNEAAVNWPTPTAGDAKASGSRNLTGSKAHAGVSLTDAVTAGTSTVSRRVRRPSKDGLVLNPQFVEAMQGFPPGWTEGGVRRTGSQSAFAF